MASNLPAKYGKFSSRVEDMFMFTAINFGSFKFLYQQIKLQPNVTLTFGNARNIPQAQDRTAQEVTSIFFSRLVKSSKFQNSLSVTAGLLLSSHCIDSRNLTAGWSRGWRSNEQVKGRFIAHLIIITLC